MCLRVPCATVCQDWQTASMSCNILPTNGITGNDCVIILISRCSIGYALFDGKHMEDDHRM